MYNLFRLLIFSSLKLTDDRLVNSNRKFVQQIDNLNIQIIDLGNKLTNLNHLYEIELKNRLDRETLSSKVVNSNDQIWKDAIDEAKQTIWNRLESMRRDIVDEISKSKNITQSRDDVSHSNSMIYDIRNQMEIRLREMGNELVNLTLQWNNTMDNKFKPYTNITNDLNDLRNQMDNLLLRLINFEQLHINYDKSLQYMKQELEYTAHYNEKIIRQHYENISDYVNLVVGNLSKVLHIQIREVTNEIVLEQIQNLNLLDPLLLDKISHIVSTMTKESIEKFMHDYRSEGKANNVMGNEFILKLLIEESLDKFAADRTGLVDFALESAGGSIMGTRCTRTYTEGASLFSLFGLPLARLSNSPRTIIQPSNYPGDCWPFHGSQGQVVIRMSVPILIDAVSLEHLDRNLSPNGRLDSAPKEFVIKVLESEYDEEGIVLGTFIYDIEKKPIQTFAINVYEKPVQYLEFIVLSNHGHPKYTCVYRLRVHGQIVHKT